MNDTAGDKVAAIEASPLVTFALLTYNQEKYIREAVEGALAQTYSPLEILISDDHSSDETFALIKEMVGSYIGPHQIKLNRNSENLGLIEHVNKIFEISSGELIVYACGDDISLPERVACLVEAYEGSGGKAQVIHSSAMKIDDDDNELGIFIPPVAKRSRTLVELTDSPGIHIGATAMYAKSLYLEFGPIVFKDAYEDHIYGFRAALKDSLLYVDKPLVRYRWGVGISAKPKTHSLLNFSKRKEARMRKLKMRLDINEQRLVDIERIAMGEGVAALKAVLLRNVSLNRNQLLFYQYPLALLARVFSKDCVVALKSFKLEISHLIRLTG